MRLLHGTELNIDGERVDRPDEFLAGFDLCVASVHSLFALPPRDEVTRRLVRACENPFVNIIGHLTALLIGRPSLEAGFDEVFRACVRTGTALEINAFPDRLDLRDEHILWAKQYGVKFAINSDAHATPHLDVLRFGVATAQPGWLTADDVINT
jgi:DNA polymerase (family 10)